MNWVILKIDQPMLFYQILCLDTSMISEYNSMVNQVYIWTECTQIQTQRTGNDQRKEKSRNYQVHYSTVAIETDREILYFFPKFLLINCIKSSIFRIVFAAHFDHLGSTFVGYKMFDYVDAISTCITLSHMINSRHTQGRTTIKDYFEPFI